ncbi:torsin-1A-like [Mytilus californianus]|uniref:torsin-1A-like n=1 Tax=Mytilus californianus TaxID=6549 RepID=UPI0022468A3D|nr:torsin-1A-like [Mytilus californianus]
MSRNYQVAIHSFFQLFLGSECLITIVTSIGFTTLFFTCWIISISVHSIYNESCNERWIHLDTAELTNTLNTRVYGEHIAVKTVVNHLNAHFMNENPPKALTFSFHGGPGTGKTLITKILVDHLYNEGSKSQFVHTVIATRDFPHKRNTDENNIKLRKLIEDKVKQCERSMFIFDEVDKLSPDLINILKPYLDHHEHIDNIDYRKAIFIFLSNTAGQLLTKQMIDFWHDGKKRDEIDLKDLENVLATSASNYEGSGYYKSDLIFHDLITAYIPFLPIEKEHVFGCIKHHLLAKRYYKHYIDIPIKTIEEIAQQLQFYPNETDKLFSATGCKRVEEKVDYVMGGTS